MDNNNTENGVLDQLVCFAYGMRKEYPRLLELAAFDQLTDGNMVWPYHVMMKITGQSEDVCLGLCERAADKDLVDFGTSVRSGWLTEAGQEVLKRSGLRYTDFFDKAFERGIPSAIIEEWSGDKKSELIEEMDKLDLEQEQVVDPPRSKLNPEFETSTQDNKNQENSVSKPTPGK